MRSCQSAGRGISLPLAGGTADVGPFGNPRGSAHRPRAVDRGTSAPFRFRRAAKPAALTLIYSGA